MIETSSWRLYFPRFPNAILSEGRKKGPSRHALPLKVGAIYIYVVTDP